MKVPYGEICAEFFGFLSILKLSPEIEKWRERLELSHDERIIIIVDKDLGSTSPE